MFYIIFLFAERSSVLLYLIKHSSFLNNSIELFKRLELLDKFLVLYIT